MSKDAYPPANAPAGQPSAQHPLPGATMQQPSMGASHAMYQAHAPHPAAMGMPYGGYAAGHYPGYQQMTMAPMAAQPGAGAHPNSAYPATSAPSSFLSLGNDRFLKGLLIGAAAAYLLTNENVQRTAIKGVVKLWGSLQGGVEEIKERFADAEAEIQATESHKDA